jgi:hypothetical protein
MGQTLYGAVETVYLRGVKVYDGGAFGPTPTGRLLKRGDAD